MYHANQKFRSSLLRIAVLAFMGTALLLGCGRQTNIIAEVGSEKITVDEFRQELIRQHKTEKDAARQDLASRKKSLEDLVERRLKVAAARAEGFFDTEEILARRKAFVEEAINQELFQVEIMDQVITDELIKDIYERQGEELQASHILLKWAEDSTKVRQHAIKIKAEIENGLTFDEAAAKYTEEPGGKERKGELGWFSWGRMVDPFQQAAWGLDTGSQSFSKNNTAETKYF